MTNPQVRAWGVLGGSSKVAFTQGGAQERRFRSKPEHGGAHSPLVPEPVAITQPEPCAWLLFPGCHFGAHGTNRRAPVLRQRCVTALAIALSAYLVVEQAHAQASSETPSAEAAAIQTSYRVLSSYMEGRSVSFEVLDMTQVTRDELATQPLRALVSLREGQVLEFVRIHTEDVAREREFVAYRAKWNSASLSPAEEVKVSEGAGGFLKAAGIELTDIREATSVRVRATMGGRNRVYNSLFLWRFDSQSSLTDDSFHGVIVDAIVNRFGDVLSEDVPSEGRHRGGGPGDRTPSLPSIGQAAASQQCVAGTTTTSYKTGDLKNTNAHISGAHHASFAWGYSCTCRPDCSQTCDASVTNSSCFENGIAQGLGHSVGSNATLVTGSSLNGNTAPAACNVGFGCAVKACLFGVCSVSVTVVSHGTTVTVTPPTDSIWAFSKTDNPSRQCAPCQLAPPPPPYVPPGGFYADVPIGTVDVQDVFWGFAGGISPGCVGLYVPGPCNQGVCHDYFYLSCFQ